MVKELNISEAELIARAGWETGQIGFFEYHFPSMFMPNGGVYVLGDIDGQQTKYLIAWRDGYWRGQDLTVPGQSQTEVEVYADAIIKGLQESFTLSANILLFGALAVGGYWLYRKVKK